MLLALVRLCLYVIKYDLVASMRKAITLPIKIDVAVKSQRVASQSKNFHNMNHLQEIEWKNYIDISFEVILFICPSDSLISSLIKVTDIIGRILISFWILCIFSKIIDHRVSFIVVFVSQITRVQSV